MRVTRGGDVVAYAALRVAALLGARLPRPIALGTGAALGRLARDVFGLRRRVTEQNLAIAFPDLEAAARRGLARRMYAHYGRMVVETFRVASSGGREVVPRMRGSDAADLMRELLAHGRGLLVLTGHLGNWEVAAAYLSAVGMPVAAVVKPPANRWIARYVDRERRRIGIETIPMPEARSGVLAALEAGKVVALVADQSPLRGSTWVPFFGRPTKTAEGPGLFAARSGSPVVFAGVVAEPGGYRGFAEVLDEAPAGETRVLVERIATLYRVRLEAAIRRTPEQYLWTHRLWRRQPPAAPAAP